MGDVIGRELCRQARMLVRAALCVVAAAALVLGVATPARASVTDLHSALVSRKEAPPGLLASHYRVYSRFTPKMAVSTVSRGLGPGTSECHQPPSTAGYHWRQGIIEAFDSANAVSMLTLCGALFAADGDAHRAYLAYARSLRSGVKKSKGTSLHPVRGLGDEAIAAGGARAGLAIGDLIFRRQNAVVEIMYLGSSRYTLADFLRLSQRVGRRLR